MGNMAPPIWAHQLWWVKRLHAKNLIDSFTVDTKTPTPDCTSCMQAKQSCKSFDPKAETWHKVKGELTHMDLWGKYEISSISGHQYYLLLVDDATRYITVYFLKGKHEAAQQVKNYMTHLHVCSITTHGIRVDHGTEFINKNLQDWCHAKGMEIELTAPYSPSQNGIVEHMNCMLVELARTMITASGLSEFLWEPIVAYATYVCNRSYTMAVTDNVTGIWDGFVPWTRISWATGHSVCIYSIVFLKEYRPYGHYWYFSHVVVLMDCSSIPMLLFW